MLSYSTRVFLWAAIIIALSVFSLPHSAHAAAALVVSNATSTSNNASSTIAKPGDVITFGLKASGNVWTAPLISVLNLGTTTMTGANAIWTFSTTSVSSWPNGNVTFTIQFGNTDGTATTTFTSAASTTFQHVVFDKTAPTLSTVTTVSNNASTTLAKAGNVITLYASSSEAIQTPTITIDGQSATVSMLSASTSWMATYTVVANDTNAAAINISFSDMAGNAGTAVTAVTSGSVVYVDTIGPVITVNGNNPDSIAPTTAGYSDPVATAVDAHDGSVSVSTSGSVTSGTTGAYSLSYSATDAAGNTSSATRTVNVGAGSSGPPVGLLSGGSLCGTPIVPGGWTSNSSACGGATGSSSSGSGGSTGSTGSTNSTASSLQAQVQALMAQIAALTGKSSAGSASFSRNLQVGSTGNDVKALQVYLNTHGFVVAASGPGSSGNETTKFGAFTKKALAAWQASVGISPASGFFGPITRAYIAAH